MTKVVGTFLLVTISFIIYHVILFKRRKSSIPKSNHCFFGIEERLAGFKYNIDRWGGKGRGYTGGVDRYVLFYGSFSTRLSLNGHWRACTFFKNASPSLNVYNNLFPRGRYKRPYTLTKGE